MRLEARGVTVEKKYKKKRPTKPSRDDLQKWKQTKTLGVSWCIGYHDPMLPVTGGWPVSPARLVRLSRGLIGLDLNSNYLSLRIKMVDWCS